MNMTLSEQMITILVIISGTALTRFLPFILFPDGKSTPKFISFLGKFLPGAVFGMLVIYCLKNVNLFSCSHGIPEAIAIIVVVILHLWKRQMLLSISVGTVLYMVLVQTIF